MIPLFSSLLTVFICTNQIDLSLLPHHQGLSSLLIKPCDKLTNGHSKIPNFNPWNLQIALSLDKGSLQM